MSGDLRERLQRAAASVWAQAHPEEALDGLWRADGTPGGPLPATTAAELRGVHDELRQAGRSLAAIAPLMTDVGAPAATLVARWAEGAADDEELQLGPLLRAAARAGARPRSVERAARARLRRGPVVDALECLPLTGPTDWLLDDPAARARLELLLWEGGREARGAPAVATWLLEAPGAYQLHVAEGARGSLRQRSLAARVLALGAAGFQDSEGPIQHHLDRQLRTLMAHPDPLVWIHGARACGRMAVQGSRALGLVREWLDSGSVGERRRAVTALASMPAREHAFVLERLAPMLAESKDPWLVSAIGTSIPDLATSHRELWRRVATRLETAELPAQVWWAVTQGLVPLVQREDADDGDERVLDRARRTALEATTTSATDAMLWRDVRLDTAFLDDVTDAGLDPFRRSEALARDALRLEPPVYLERALGLARGIQGGLPGDMAAARQKDSFEERVAGIANLESAAQALAVALWEPVIQLVGGDLRNVNADVAAARGLTGHFVAEVVEDGAVDYPLHRGALRILGSLFDGTPAPVAHATMGVSATPAVDERGRHAGLIVEVLNGAPWIVTMKKRDASRFRKALADLLWRVLEATRRGPDDDLDRLLERVVTWWAFAAESTTLLRTLTRTEVAARDARFDQAVTGSVALSAAFRAAGHGEATLPHADDGALPPADELRLTLLQLLPALGIADTALGAALTAFVDQLETLERAEATRAGGAAPEAAWRRLAAWCSGVEQLLESPTRALGTDPGPSRPGARFEELVRRSLEAGSLDAAARDAIARRWGAELGPLLRRPVTRLARRLLELDPSTGERHVGAYRLVQQLGAGGMGEVWQVEHRDNRGRFVMKLPLVDVRASSVEVLRQSLLVECDALRQLSHPNIAGFIDHGWDGETPYLVVERLIGMDLEAFLRRYRPTPTALTPIVSDLVAGLRALHRAGLVHRDLKPGNVFLRMDYDDDGEALDESTILSTVLIDFGIASRTHGGGSGGVTGTLGFMAPEQARGDALITPAADVYALAATLYFALSGAGLFAGIDDSRSRLFAHGTRAPFEEEGILGAVGLGDDLTALMKSATALEPEARPSAREFGRRWRAAAGG